MLPAMKQRLLPRGWHAIKLLRQPDKRAARAKVRALRVSALSSEHPQDGVDHGGQNQKDERISSFLRLHVATWGQARLQLNRRHSDLA